MPRRSPPLRAEAAGPTVPYTSCMAADSAAAPHPQLRFASGLALAPLGADDVAAVAAGVRADLGTDADFAFVFMTPQPAEDAGAMLDAVRGALGTRTLAGCTAAGVIAGTKEIEYADAVTVWAAAAVGDPLELEVAQVEFLDVGDGAFVGMPALRRSADDRPPAAVIVLVDPTTFPADAFIDRLDAQIAEDFGPGAVPVLGGLASGAASPGENKLFVDDQVAEAGAVVAVLRGPVRMQTLVSQGARPVGSPWIVTKADENVLQELAGVPALERLVGTIEALPTDERTLIAENGVLVGQVIDESKVDFGPGDFLVRNLIGVDRSADAVAVGAFVPVGATVQLHVRDAETAEADLAALLATGDAGAAGALLFTCNGRGRNLFGGPDHDATAVAGAFDGIATSGFFCAGEIGPVAGRTFLHGFTASIGLLLPADDERPVAAQTVATEPVATEPIATEPITAEED